MKIATLFLALIVIVTAALRSSLASVAAATTSAVASPTLVQGGPCDSPVGCPGPGITGACGRIPATVFSQDQDIDLSTTGIYDPVRWLVILDYERFEILPGVTVTFRNHPKNPPVVLMSRCPIVIRGTLALNGDDGAPGGQQRRFTEPGPGGFWGGMGGSLAGGPGNFSSAGHGPGGGCIIATQTGCAERGGAGSFSTQGFYSDGCYGAPASHLYGIQGLAALVGGSGGGAGNYSGGQNGAGGGGGGAILIGSDTSIELSGGQLTAVGGRGGSGIDAGGGGSGGMIRLVAPSILAANAVVDVRGGLHGLTTAESWRAGSGRIEVATNQFPVPGISYLPSGSVTSYSLGEFLPSSPPSVRIVSWRASGAAGWTQSVTQDPTGMTLTATEADHSLPSQGAYELRIQGLGIAANTPIEVRLTYTRGQGTYIGSTLSLPPSEPGDPLGSVYAIVPVDLQLGVSTVQVRAML